MHRRSKTMCFMSRGIALVTVLSIATVLMLMADILIISVRRNRPLQERRFEQVQATYLARGAVELILLKIRTLPNEFYDAYKDLKARVKEEGSEETGRQKAQLYQEFIRDFISIDAKGNIVNFPKAKTVPLRPIDDDLARVHFIKFSIIGETPILATAASEEYYEEDLMKIIVEARIGETVREITQVINLSRGVKLQ